MLVKKLEAVLKRASLGQSINQSSVQQFIKEGNFLHLILSFSPAGDMQSTTCNFFLVWSTNMLLRSSSVDDKF